MPLDALAQRVGLSPTSPTLRHALTHSSFAAENDTVSNERLEFLGDAVVDLAVADFIVTSLPHLDEGQSTVLRSRVVNEETLAAAARALGLGDLLLLGRGVHKERGAERDSLLADAFEALVAAIYLDNGFAAARTFVVAQLAPSIEQADQKRDLLDIKTQLLRWAEASGWGPPQYEVTASGPSHDPTFHATVRVSEWSASATGTSKKKAEARAAQALWEESAYARTT